MKIGIFGTGIVAETLGSKLIERGHEVRLGARSSTNEKAAAWAQKAGPNASHGTFADAARFGEVLINVTSGAGSLPALEAAGAEALGSKILLDVSNPLDFSKGMPPSLFVSNTDSLGEQLQRAFPALRVVKTLNTMSCFLMVDPARVAGGDHSVFVSGNDAEAKAKTKGFLAEWFGWKVANIIDLGDITTARGTESLLPIWLRLWGALQTADFNFKIAR